MRGGKGWNIPVVRKDLLTPMWNNLCSGSLNHFWILTFAAFKMSNRHIDYWVKINDDIYFILWTQIIKKCIICWCNVFLHSLFRPAFHVFYIFRGPDGRNLDMKIAASTKIMIREILFSKLILSLSFFIKS